MLSGGASGNLKPDLVIFILFYKKNCNVIPSVCKLFKYFGSKKTKIGHGGVNFQSIAWAIGAQIPLQLMGFVGVSVVHCFENSFHSIHAMQAWRRNITDSVLKDDFVFISPKSSSTYKYAEKH